jgi:carbon-monoxide dehydrogenase large subunit
MAGSIIGAAVKRTEDPRFITGAGTYIPNLEPRDAAYVVTVRSPFAHARVNSIDTSSAREAHGVIGVYTADDLDLPDMPLATRYIPEGTERPVMARETVRFAGEVLAVVVAETEPAAVDASQLVFADLDPLPAVSNIESALAPDAPQIWDHLEGNVVYRSRNEPVPDVLDGADVVVSVVLENQRCAAVPMEPNSTLAVPNGAGVDVWLGSQNVFGHRKSLSKILGIDEQDLRVVVPDMGGGFGAKFPVYPQQVITAELARRLQRPVRWHETRRENLVTMYHGRDQRQHVEIGATRDGRIVGMRALIYQNTGAYPAFATWLPKLTRYMASGVYAIPRMDVGFVCVTTNTTPTDAYRGAGRPEATAMVERTIDILAAELGMDPAEIRRINFIPKFDEPHETAVGAIYDSGDYDLAFTAALQTADYESLRTEQTERRHRRDRHQLGIGLSSYVEVTAAYGDKEWSSVEVDIDGIITVRVGTSAHGQGHETTFTQIAARQFKVPFDRIKVIQGDTAAVKRGAGTGGSRSLQIGGSSIRASGEEVITVAKQAVADHLEAGFDDVVVFDNGTLGVAGVPDTGLEWGEVARLVTAAATEDTSDEAAPRLYAEVDFEQDEGSFPFGTHVSVVEVDTETGATRLLRHVAVDDCGNIFNPVLVDGQVHGGIAQGVGQALSEKMVYDEDANPLSGTLMSYLIPTADMFPNFEIEHTMTPTNLNPLGVKGIGEAATIGSTPAIANAVIDAVSHLGVRHIDMPLTASRVWQAIRDAAEEA